MSLRRHRARAQALAAEIGLRHDLPTAEVLGRGRRAEIASARRELYVAMWRDGYSIADRERGQVSKYILMAVSHHTDGSTSGVELHRGTKAECEAVWDRLPGAAATGADVESVELVIGTEEQWEKSTAGGVPRPS